MGFYTYIVPSRSKNRSNKIAMTPNGEDQLREVPSSAKTSAKIMVSKNSRLLNNTRRKAEDKMAKMFMWIVVVFITCHLPR